MNIQITPAIIARLESEVCPTHGKSAKVFAENDMLSIQEACCPEFHQHLIDLSNELLGKKKDPNNFLERFLGLR
jgi:hypothetical protein